MSATFFKRLLCGSLFLLCAAGSALAVDRDIRNYGAKCDGVTNDVQAVQAAIDAAQPGDMILIPGPKLTGIADPGFTMSKKTNVTMRGVDGGGFITLAETLRGMNGFSYVLNQVQNSTDCTVENLYFNGNNKNVTPIGFDQNTNCTAQQITVRDVGSFTGNNNDSPSAAFAATGNTRNKYIGITIDNTVSFPGSDGTRGMWIGNGNPGQYEWYPIITGCMVSNTGYTGIAGHPIAGHLYNNEVWGTKGGACIKQVPAPPAVSIERTIIENNYCHDSTSQGLQFDWTHHITIRNNVLVRNSCAAIFLSPGQPIEKCEEAGIKNGCMDVIVTDNVIIDPGPEMCLAGVYVHGAANLEISNNVIRETRTGEAKTMCSGITLDCNYAHYDNIRMINNVIDGAKWNGISMWAGKARYENITIGNNVIKASDQHGLIIDPKAERKNIQVYGNVFNANAQGDLDGVMQTDAPAAR